MIVVDLNLFNCAVQCASKRMVQSGNIIFKIQNLFIYVYVFEIISKQDKCSF